MPVKRSGVGYADFSGADLNFVIRGRRGDCECSPGCINCYALALLERFGRVPEHTTIYPDKLRRLRTARFEDGGRPFRRGPGSRPLLFPCDFGDLFHDLVPTEFILEALDVMAGREDCDWLILTKRIERLARIQHDCVGEPFPENLFIGTTTENQEMLNRRTRVLVENVKCSVRWLSAEPALQGMDASHWLYSCPNCGARLWDGNVSDWRFNGMRWEHCDGYPIGHVQTEPDSLIDWIAYGAESGPNRRTFFENWAWEIRDTCAPVEGTGFFYKQGSHLYPGRNRVLDGRTWDELPVRSI